MTRNLVYKYVAPARLDVLKDGRIRFTQPDALNDPFELLPCLTQYKAALVEGLRDKRLQKYGETLANVTDAITHDMVSVTLDDMPKIMSNVFAFLSVTRIPDDLLMWSHYADSHKGFVIGFDADNEFFAPGRFSRDGLEAVEYSRERLVMPTSGLAGLSPEEMEAANTRLIFTKSIDWRYEQEMRLIAMPSTADKTVSTPGKPDIYLFDFPLDAVQEVIFGCEMADHVKDEIAGLLDDKYPHASLLQARIHDDRYALEILSFKKFSRAEERLRAARKLFPTKVVVDQAKAAKLREQRQVGVRLQAD